MRGRLTCVLHTPPCCWWKRYYMPALLHRVAAHKPIYLLQLLPHLQQPPDLAALRCVVKHVAPAPVALRDAGSWGQTRECAILAQQQRRSTLDTLRRCRTASLDTFA